MKCRHWLLLVCDGGGEAGAGLQCPPLHPALRPPPRHRQVQARQAQVQAEKEREELGDCLRKASKETASDEEGRNCNSPCTISKIAGNDLIGMSQQQEEEVTQSQFESKDNVNGIEETTDTTPVSAVEGLFF